jgi:hypothetical protein
LIQTSPPEGHAAFGNLEYPQDPRTLEAEVKANLISPTDVEVSKTCSKLMLATLAHASNAALAADCWVKLKPKCVPVAGSFSSE